MKDLIKEKILLYRVQAKKDADAFAELYDLYVEPIYRFVFFKISHAQEAEDVTSDVFLRCWQYLVGETGPSVRTFSGLVYTVARNCIIDVYRERAKRNERPIGESDDFSDIGSGARALETTSDTHLLLNVIHKMKQEYQEVIILKYIEGCSVAEIATLLGKSQTGIRVTAHRALKKLKQLTEGT